MSSKLIKLFASILALSILAPPAHAVCSFGQIAIGTETITEDIGDGDITTMFSGFEMAQNCGLISQSGVTEDASEVCQHDGWTGGADVTCDDTNTPTTATDTTGHMYTCAPTTDTSCDIDDGQTAFVVKVCCGQV